MKLGFYLFAEYINMFVSSAIIVTLFFGGYNFPFMDKVATSCGPMLFTIICILTLLTKVVCMILFFMFVRWTVPRFRYDQLMSFAWKFLFPAALLNLLVTGFLVALVP